MLDWGRLRYKATQLTISLAVDYFYSWDEERGLFPFVGFIDFRGETIEINPGLRYIWERFPYIRPFIGVRPSIIWARFEGESWGITVWDSEWTLGFWAGGGVYVTLAKHLDLWIQGKYSYAKVNLFGVNADAGGWHLAGLVGFHWQESKAPNGRELMEQVMGKAGDRDHGPEADPLFYACFECPYPDCRYHEIRSKECPFRIKWGRKHGVDPGYLARFREAKDGRGRPRKI